MQSLCSHISLTAAKTIVFIQHQICRFCCKTGDKDKAEIIRKKTQFCHHFLLHKKIIFRLQNPIFELVITKAFSLNKELFTYTFIVPSFCFKRIYRWMYMERKSGQLYFIAWFNHRCLFSVSSSAPLWSSETTKNSWLRAPKGLPLSINTLRCVGLPPVPDKRRLSLTIRVA